MTLTAPIRVVRSIHAADNGFLPRPGFEVFRDDAINGSIVDQFARIVARCPSAIAIVDGPRRCAYAELLERARLVALEIAERLEERPGAVALRINSGLHAIECLLGALVAGRPYLFLPPSGDSAGVDILRAAGVACIVSDSTPPDWLSVGDVANIVTHRDAARPSTFASVPSMVSAAGGPDHACLFATSGTTGTPKLVGLSHRAVLFDIGRQVRDLFIGPDDRIDLLFQPSFSASLAPMFSALLSGAELHLRSPTPELRGLGRWLRDSRITISTMAVSTFRALVATLDEDGVGPDLRLLSVGGEPLLERDVAMFLQKFPTTCVLQNAMASTETRTYAQYFVTHRSPTTGVVPIGWAVEGKDVLVIDAHGRPTPPDTDGEIVVRSRFLADGYVNDPALTAQRFVPQGDGTVWFHTGDRGRFRPDGCVSFLGRMDSLVKIRGYRVDTGAVEEALRAIANVAAAAVVVHTVAGESLLVAFVVLHDPGHRSVDAVRSCLRERLPAAAVPQEIRILAALPLNANGKVDYRALRQEADRRPLITSRRPDEILTVLCAAWASAINRDPVDPDDDFFARGGDSLNAARLQSTIFEVLGREVPFAAIVAEPTPRRLAAWLDRDASRQPVHPALVQLARAASGVPLFCVPGIGGEPLSFQALADRIGSTRPVYGLGATQSLEAAGGPVTIERLASEYVRAIQAVIAVDDPVLLCGHSFGAIVALEMTHQLKAAGRHVPLLAVIDTPLGGRRRGLLGRIRDVSMNLPGWIRYDVLESEWPALVARGRGKASDWWRRALAALRVLPPPVYPDLRTYFGQRDIPPEVLARTRARLDAIRNYRRRPVDGTVVLLRSRGQALTGRSDRCLGWDVLASTVETYDVPGHHDSSVHPPHVDRTAAAIAYACRARGL